MLMAAITNGATHMSPSASSTMGLAPRAGAGLQNRGEREGLRSRSSTPGSAAAAMVAFEAGGRAARRKCLSSCAPGRARGWRVAKARFHFVCSRNTPRSNGIESKPHENTMRAPLAWARGFVGVNHLAHPRGLAAQVHVIDPGGGAGGHQFVAIELVGPTVVSTRRVWSIRACRLAGCWCRSRPAACRRGAHFVAHGGEFFGIAPAHGPAQAAACG